MALAGIPAQSAFVLIKPESSSITESWGDTAATLPSAPGSPVLLGYCNVPDRRRGLNNSVGKAIGVPGGAYSKRGARNPSISPTIRGGGYLAALEYLNRSGSDLTNLCIWVGVSGAWTEVYRFCKMSQLGISIQESATGEAQEIEFTPTFEAQAMVTMGSPMTFDAAAAVAGLDAPLFYGNFTDFTIGSTNYRERILSANLTINNNLERKGQRLYWGDDEPLSLTNLQILPHNIDVTGEVTFHQRLPRDLFETAADSQDWGDVTLRISDTPSGGDQVIYLTLKDVMPADETGPATESGSQITHTVPIVARNYTLELEDPEVEGGGD